MRYAGMATELQAESSRISTLMFGGLRGTKIHFAPFIVLKWEHVSWRAPRLHPQVIMAQYEQLNAV